MISEKTEKMVVSEEYLEKVVIKAEQQNAVISEERKKTDVREEEEDKSDMCDKQEKIDVTNKGGNTIIDVDITKTTIDGAAYHYEVRSGRGVCVVADRDIRAGELLITDSPLFTVPAALHNKVEELDTYLESAVSQLDPVERSVLHSLADCKAGEAGAKTNRGIYFTNCFTLGQTMDSPAGILPIVSRFISLH